MYQKISRYEDIDDIYRVCRELLAQLHGIPLKDRIDMAIATIETKLSKEVFDSYEIGRLRDKRTRAHFEDLLFGRSKPMGATTQ